MKGDCAVGHLPYNLVPTVSAFLKRDTNKVMAEVTGERVNHGVGYGLEVLCTYRFYGSQLYINRLWRLMDSLLAAGHL